MNTAKLEQKLKRNLAGVGLEIRPDSAAARGLSRLARVGASVVTSGNRVLRTAEGSVRAAAEAAREKIHEATRPRAGQVARRRSRTTTRKRALHPRRG